MNEVGSEEKRIFLTAKEEFEARTVKNKIRAAELLRRAAERLSQIDTPISGGLADALAVATRSMFPEDSQVGSPQEQQALSDTLDLFGRMHWLPDIGQYSTGQDKEQPLEYVETAVVYEQNKVQLTGLELVAVKKTPPGQKYEGLLLIESGGKLPRGMTPSVREFFKVIKADSYQQDALPRFLGFEEKGDVFHKKPGLRLCVCPNGSAPLIEIFPDTKKGLLEISGPGFRQPLNIKTSEPKKTFEHLATILTAPVYPIRSQSVTS